MFLDSRTLPAGTSLDAEVCIIGAGAAGITLAQEFTGRPVRVILLESGGLDPNSQTQQLYQGRNVGLPYFPLTVCRLRYFGGATNHWAGECRPFDEIDFEARDGIPFSGWPFSKSHLAPFYRRAESICQLAPVPYDAETWATDESPPLPLAGSRLVTHILQRSPPTRFGKAYHAPLERAENVRVCLHANVLTIETDPQARTVNRVAVTTLERKTFAVSAKLFVLAVGGIENARLLLCSNEAQPAGLGNQHDLVGRFFMEHVSLATSLWLRPPQPMPLQLYTHHVVQKPSHQGRILGSLTFPSEVLRQERLLNFRCELVPPASPDQPASPAAGTVRRGRAPDRFMSDLWHVLTDLGGAAGALRRRLRPSPPQGFALAQVSEQAPNPDSRVRLSTQRDPFGRPRVELAWRLSGVDRRSIARTQELLAREFGQLGLGRVKTLLDAETETWPVRGEHHHMGTTRMHADPTQGVVDPNCRIHGMTNLFVAGSSVFPTSGGGTPTLTIVALALRLADHLKGLLG